MDLGKVLVGHIYCNVEHVRLRFGRFGESGNGGVGCVMEDSNYVGHKMAFFSVGLFDKLGYATGSIHLICSNSTRRDGKGGRQGRVWRLG